MDVFGEYLNLAKKAALQAGVKILDIYNQPNFEVSIKEDSSPLTQADRCAHEHICSILEATGLPILSEEGTDIPFEERKGWEWFWMVDPLDGTKEFIKKNGEFTVNIALIKRDTPVMGVVYVPVQGKLYFNSGSTEAFCIVDGHMNALKSKTVALDEPQPTVIASRSHLNPETESYIKALDRPNIISRGSSLKFMVIAEGKADVYPRFAPTMEWDTAAAHAIVNASGGKVLNQITQTPLIYNKQSLLNPSFLAFGNTI